MLQLAIKLPNGEDLPDLSALLSATRGQTANHLSMPKVKDTCTREHAPFSICTIQLAMAIRAGNASTELEWLSRPLTRGPRASAMHQLVTNLACGDTRPELGASNIATLIPDASLSCLLKGRDTCTLVLVNSTMHPTQPLMAMVDGLATTSNSHELCTLTTRVSAKHQQVSNLASGDM